MKKVIDLHGLTHEESLVKVEEYLLLNSFDNDLDLELITGKSPKLQQKIINQILNRNRALAFLTPPRPPQDAEPVRCGKSDVGQEGRVVGDAPDVVCQHLR